MTHVKAIDTIYRGYRFRSRLEARWAVFFDALGVSWQYEPEGFEKSGDRYLPDFRIMDARGAPIWVEVKGNPTWVADNRQMLSRWMAAPSIIPSGRLLLLGDLPRGGGCVLVAPLVGKAAHLEWQMLCFNESGFFLHPTGDLVRMFTTWEADQAFFGPLMIDAPMCWPKISSALSAARMARFEHGESGAR